MEYDAEKYKNIYVQKRVDVRMVIGLVLCDACDIAEYGERTPELSNAALHTKQDNTSTPVHQYREKDRPLNINLRLRRTYL